MKKYYNFIYRFNSLFLRKKKKINFVSLYLKHIVFQLRICRKSDKTTDFIWVKEIYAKKIV